MTILTDPQLWALLAVVALSIACLAGAWHAWRNEAALDPAPCTPGSREAPPHSAEEQGGPDWFRALMFTAAFFTILAVTGRIDLDAALADEAQREADASAIRLPPSALIEARQALAARELAKGFGQCPPRGEGMTDIVTLVIKTSADNGPEVITCIRYAERPFVPKRRPAARG